MFTEQVDIMLYVTDVSAEYHFWKTIGFELGEMIDMSGYSSFSMKPHPDSNLAITIYDKVFIQQVSPEVADNVPSILFEALDIEQLHEKIAAVTEHISPLREEPFVNFNFSTPSGLFFAVKAG